MKKKLYIVMILLLSYACALLGQESRSLPFLELTPDARSAAMGGTLIGESKGMYLYSNPTSLLTDNSKVYASYTFGLLPKTDGMHQSYHAASAGYKFLKKHAVMVGLRYLGGLSVPSFDLNGVRKKDIKPDDWSMDIAYTLKISEMFSAYMGAGLIQSYIGKTGYAFGVNGGVYYNNHFSFMKNSANYTLGLAFYDLGSKIKYGKRSSSYNLPTSTGIGGSVSLPFSHNHQLNVAVSTRYFMLPSDASAFTGGIGLEYELFKTASIRTGYHIDSYSSNNNYYSVGLGFNIKYFDLSVAYNLRDNKDYNILSLGLNFKL